MMAAARERGLTFQDVDGGYRLGRVRSWHWFMLCVMARGVAGGKGDESGLTYRRRAVPYHR